MDLLQELQQLGLGEKQSRLYVAALQLGAATVSEIARKAEVKRVTAYGLLDELVDRQLMTLSPGATKRLYVAEDPRALRTVPRRMEERIEQVMPELYAIYNAQATKPRVRAYEGIDGIKTIWEELIASQEKAYRYLGATSTFFQLADETYLEEISRRRIEAGVWSYGLRSPSSGDDASQYQAAPEFLREIRYLAKPLGPNLATLYLFDDKVAIQSAAGETFGLIIQSSEMVALLRPMWELLWDQASSQRPV